MSERQNVLHVEHVTMQFGGVVAMNDLSMDVNEGEIVALIGPNGAGKTTAFNCITGVYEPTNGKIDFCGKPLVENYLQGKMDKAYLGQNKGMYTHKLNPTPDRITHRGIARTFQNIRLFGALTVFDNVLIAKHMRAKQNFLSATFRLNAKEEARMRAEAMALLEEQGMNPQETQELTDFIREIRDKYHLTVLMIEHHMDLVMQISDRIYVLDFGKLIAEGTPEEVSGNQRVIDAYLGVADDAEN